jgi:hypothetical protein
VSASKLLDNATNGEDSQNNDRTASPEADGILPDDSAFSYIGRLSITVHVVICKLIIIGDQRGPRSSVYDLCHPGAPQDARPYLPIGTVTRLWKPYEMEYLKQEGAFDTLPGGVCDSLIHCYFQHVHFFLPVIDAPGFLNEYVSNGPRNISRLLLWSICLAASNVSAGS